FSVIFLFNNLAINRFLFLHFTILKLVTYTDFCQFCGSFIDHILEIRIVRIYGMKDRYSILIRLDSQDSADRFFKHFNFSQFSSLQEEVCRVYFTENVHYRTGSIEYSQESPASSADQPTCVVCLERLDQDRSGIFTTICNHSFHCSCMSNWTDSSCPVCRYHQQQPEKSICNVCQTSENLWMCIICGFFGCGRDKEGHAIGHWKDTQHCYSLDLETRRVWDYEGDNYVHRLIQSKTDRKLVERNSHCLDANDGTEICEGVDFRFTEVLLNSEVEATVNKYNELLTYQLEKQRLEKKAAKVKDDKIKQLEEQFGLLLLMELPLAIISLFTQLRDLMKQLSESDSDGIKDGTAFPIPKESSSKTKSAGKANK
ncbi:BRAP2 RING ZnF UBP domain-containing protein 2-like, partial [Humulus lupulus]|uniref:BRAP2 RING ZnF UBP domain-containing protein 2-like n=1 Tax=Humulus lupulus TaxID=3486 RepID=UPI002B40F3B3